MRQPGPSADTIVLRVAILMVAPVIATWGAHEIRDARNFQIRPDNEQPVHRLIMLGAAAYVGLLAFPFVPGAEIGLAMLAAFGAAIAPLIYICTLAAMMPAYTAGCILPIEALRHCPGKSGWQCCWTGSRRARCALRPCIAMLCWRWR
jgi:hypothetical protein